MKKQLIQGLAEYLRMDAFTFNVPDRTYLQVVTFTAGEYKTLSRRPNGPQKVRLAPLVPPADPMIFGSSNLQTRVH